MRAVEYWMLGYAAFRGIAAGEVAVRAASNSAFLRRFRSFCLRSRLNLDLSPTFPDMVDRFLSGLLPA